MNGKVVAVAAATVAAPLSSRLSDEAFTEMKTLNLKGPNSDEDFINMDVLATARYSNKASRCGTVVVIFTHLGQITLDGTDIYFEERIANAFTAAGFSTTMLEFSNFGGRRRLSAAALLQGLFNAVADMKEARCVENENPIEGYLGLRDGPLPDLPTGDKWKMKLSSYSECDTTTDAKREFCLRHPGAARHPVDFPGKFFFKTNRNINMGDAITSATTLSWDTTGRTMKSYTQGLDTYNWEDKDGAMYNCFHNVMSEPIPAFKFEEKAVYHGDEFSVLGYPARKFTFKTLAVGDQPVAVVEVWDRKSDNKLLRLRTSSADSTEASTGMNFNDVVEMTSLSNSRESTEQSCVGDVCIAATAPVFDECNNYAQRVVTDPSELAGAYEPLLRTPPTVDTDTTPRSDGSVTSPPEFVPDWETCTTASANVYSDSEADMYDRTWGTTLSQAKDKCYADALCTGFSHNYNDMTYFYNTAALSTCTSPTGVAKAGITGSYMTYGKVPASRRLQTEEGGRKLGLALMSVYDLGGATIATTFSSGILSNLDICTTRRRLEGASSATYLNETLVGYNDEGIADPSDKRTATGIAEARRRRLSLFKAGWGGCIKFTSSPFSVTGCISYDVTILKKKLFTVSGCIGVGDCEGRTLIEFTLAASIGPGWPLFEAEVSGKLRGIVAGSPGGCIADGGTVDFQIGLGACLGLLCYSHTFGPWVIGGSRRRLADGSFEAPRGLRDLGKATNQYGGFGSDTARQFEKMAQDMAGQLSQ